MTQSIYAECPIICHEQKSECHRCCETISSNFDSMYMFERCVYFSEYKKVKLWQYLTVFPFYGHSKKNSNENVNYFFTKITYIYMLKQVTIWHTETKMFHIIIWQLKWLLSIFEQWLWWILRQKNRWSQFDCSLF